MEKVDIKTVHGHLFTCDNCDKIHFEFNQIGIDFSSLPSLKSFHNYLINIDGNEFESLNNNTRFHRKIHIPFPNTAIKMLLSLNDLEELKLLVSHFINDYEEQEEASKFIRKLSAVSTKQLN